MINLKKVYREEWLQLALVLSLLRVDPESYLNLNILSIGVGSLNLNNGSGWHTDSQTIVHRPAFIHPKNLDSVLLNYERDLFEDLNALGRYNRMNHATNDIHAYLLNVENGQEDLPIAGPSIEEVNVNANDSAVNSPNSIDSDSKDELSSLDDQENDTVATDELTLEDMELIETLWKQDEDMGLTLADFLPKDPEEISPSIDQQVDEIAKLKEDALNFEKKEEPKKDEPPPSQENDCWEGFAYTIDGETGEYILLPNCPTPSIAQEKEKKAILKEPDKDEENKSSINENQKLINPENQGEPKERQEENSPSTQNVADDLQVASPFSFDLQNDFDPDLLDDELLDTREVEGLLSNATLAFNEAFNLEDTLGLIDLHEIDLQQGKDEELKSKDPKASADGENEPAENMLQPPQFHHPHHLPHHRTFQSRAPFSRVDQRWSDLVFPINGSDHYAHTSHHHGYANLGHYETPPHRNVILHNNASLAAPLTTDLNVNVTYHNQGGSNIGSAVATSMNLTNSSEPIGSEAPGPYKTEPNDMMYYANSTNDTINQTTDPFTQFWESDEFNLMGINNEAGLYNGTSGATSAAAANNAHVHGAIVQNPGATVTNLLPGTDERMDASSDSAVSSMGSERVASLSDGGEWMETGSNSSHTHGDSHYNVDYASKYRSPYDCNYALESRGGAGARKKYELYGKRNFQEPTGAAAVPVKYDYDVGQNVAGSLQAQAYSTPIDSKIKYNYGLDYARHQTARSSIEQIHHNHTYNLPPESTGTLHRPTLRDKKSRKSDGEDQHLTRDEKRARALNVPISVSDIINLPMDEFNERLSKYDLSEAQLSLIRDIRRRGKNKVAAQNCRKRKLDQILSLADQVKEMRDRKIRLQSERNYMLQEKARVKERFTQLYRHVMQSLIDPSTGRPYNPAQYSLQLSADNQVVIVPKTDMRSVMDPKSKSNHHESS